MELRDTACQRSTFQSMCVFRWKVSFLQTAYNQSLFLSIHSANLCPLIGEFNPFAFKVITEREALT